MENLKSVDQKTEPKLQAVREWILAHRDALGRQGTIVASYRMYRGRRLGPFFSLRYREIGQQRSVYLGRSLALADQVGDLLDELRKDAKQRRKLARLKRQARAHVRSCKELWRKDLAALGLRLKGCEVRGWAGTPEGSTPPIP